MGAVYEAEHVAIGRRVAIKVLHPDMARNEEALPDGTEILSEESAADMTLPDDVQSVYLQLVADGAGHAFDNVRVLAARAVNQLSLASEEVGQMNRRYVGSVVGAFLLVSVSVGCDSSKPNDDACEDVDCSGHGRCLTDGRTWCAPATTAPSPSA